MGERNLLAREIFSLEEELDRLSVENVRLADENKSVWDMLDELQESAKITPATVESFVEDIKETVLDDMLKNFKAAGEA
tara:strand:+ start:1913 stop:2149 length:237 start_codon:yes stop_codon:yes gene_type:complete